MVPQVGRYGRRITVQANDISSVAVLIYAYDKYLYATFEVNWTVGM